MERCGGALETSLRGDRQERQRMPGAKNIERLETVLIVLLAEFTGIRFCSFQVQGAF